MRSNLELSKAMQLEGQAFANMTRIVFTEVTVSACSSAELRTVKYLFSCRRALRIMSHSHLAHQTSSLCKFELTRLGSAEWMI